MTQNKIKVVITDKGKKIACEFEELGENMVLLQGRQPLILRNANRWYGKTKFCNHCGICCIIKEPDWIYGIKMMKVQGGLVPVCKQLHAAGENKYLCHAGPPVPLSCIIACSPRDDELAYPYCSVFFKRLDKEEDK